MPVLSVSWRDALFAHWSVAPESVETHLPDGLALDAHDGRGWLGVVAFEVADLRPRFAPVGRSFGQVNLRTYVRGPAGPGVYFFSLDAADRLGVAVARRLFRLPYYRAEVTVERYRFYATDDEGRLNRGEINHPPWRLSEARAEIEENSLFRASGLDRPDGESRLHYCPAMDGTAGLVRRCRV